MHEQLTEHFVNNNLFNLQQYGFTKNSSTELAAIELIDRLNQLNIHAYQSTFILTYQRLLIVFVYAASILQCEK